MPLASPVDNGLPSVGHNRFVLAVWNSCLRACVHGPRHLHCRKPARIMVAHCFSSRPRACQGLKVGTVLPRSRPATEAIAELLGGAIPLQQLSNNAQRRHSQPRQSQHRRTQHSQSRHRERRAHTFTPTKVPEHIVQREDTHVGFSGNTIEVDFLNH